MRKKLYTIRGIGSLEGFVAVFVGAFLLYLILPRIFYWREAYSAEQAVAAMENILWKAQDLALTQQNRVVVQTKLGGAIAIGIDKLPYTEVGLADQEVAAFELPNGYALQANDSIIFNSTGLLIDEDGYQASPVLTLTQEDHVMVTIALHPSAAMEVH